LFNLIRKYIVYIIGGGIGSVVCLLLTYFLTEKIGFWYFYSYFVGLMTSTAFNFFYHRSVTFKIKDNIFHRLAKHFFLSVFIIFSYMALIYALTDIFRIWYILSGVITIVIMSVASFFASKRWVFKINQNEQQ
jgi:putative flippase GtrA